MKRKKHYKKIPNRHKILMDLRKDESQIKEVINREGKVIALNLSKHYYLKKPYKNKEYNKELYRKFNDYV